MAHEPDDDLEDVVDIDRGSASSDVSSDEWFSADAVIWVPDLSSQTGFSKFWVNRREQPSRRRPIGFRRR